MTTTATLVTLATERPVPIRVVKVNRDSGFDWGDAGIGATGADCDRLGRRVCQAGRCDGEQRS